MARDSIRVPAPGPTRLSVPSPLGRPNGRKPLVAAADRWTVSSPKTIGPEDGLRSLAKHHRVGIKGCGMVI